MTEPHYTQPSADPAESPQVPTKPDSRGLLREIIETILIAALIFVTVRGLILNFRVDGPSMQPTFVSDELVVVNRNAYRELDLGDFIDWLPGVSEQHWFTIVDWGTPERGDVVVFYPPEGEPQKPYIKRVIGIAGDTVEITEDRRVFVNGIELDESYIGNYTNTCHGQWNHCTATVPDGHVYVMGDNRSNSADSRKFGVVEENRIIGKAWMVMWPMDVIGPVEHPDVLDDQP